jgi:hypothetical protein
MLKKGIVSLSAVAALATTAFAGGDSNIAEQLVKMEKMMAAQAAQIKELQSQLGANSKLGDKIDKLAKKVNKNKKTITAVKKHDAKDNIKFGLDFRNSVDFISAKDKIAGTTQTNDILSTKLDITMVSSPTDKIVFRGKFGVNSVWGGHPGDVDASFKGWQSSSRANNHEFKLKEAYVLYKGDNDISYSIGRRPSTEGFLANHRNNTSKPNSPLAHVTNMEVDAAMVRLGESYTKATGSYMKVIYGRAHDPVNSVANMYLTDATYATGTVNEIDDQEVDFFGVLGNIYNDGTYKLMAQHMVILNTKGAQDIDGDGTLVKNLDTNSDGTLDGYTDIIKAGAGKAFVSALSLEVSGLDMIDEDSEALADTIAFASIAQTNYQPNEGYTLLGTDQDTKGHSIWLGATFPDQLTEDGRFGIEYNQGSKNWTPFTWAEDTMIGSKIAVRGYATELYWNTKVSGFDNLTAQVRYTRVQHDYTPNQKCQGWITPEEVDILAENMSFSVRYRY